MKDRRMFFIFSVVLLILAVCSVAYAVLRANLNVTGTARVTGNWNIYFDNLKVTNTQNGRSEKNTLSATYFNFDVSLELPGDKVVYQFDVINGGSIDAKIDSVNFGIDGSNGLEGVNYTFTYDDASNSSINVGDKLPTGATKHLKLVVELDRNVTSLPSADETITLKGVIVYVQDTSTSDIPTKTGSVTLDITKYLPDLSEDHTGAITVAEHYWVPSTNIPYLYTYEQTGKVYDKRAQVIVKKVSDGTVVGTGYEPYSNSNGNFQVTVNGLPLNEELTVSVYKNCYFQYENITTFTLTDNSLTYNVPSINIYAGDTPSSDATDLDYKTGDGVINVDDYVRILRANADEAVLLKILIDIDEDGTVNETETNMNKAIYELKLSDLYK